ncbi:hypothetical protein RUM43_002464 [Polyplax serrata]|uniref:Uncharacterized protein n=1 Tax=Polyplax serrata TaxID=468196 RepID=A0AAN8NTF7_POLSC
MAGMDDHERKIVIEFCHLLEKSKQLFNGLRWVHLLNVEVIHYLGEAFYPCLNCSIESYLHWHSNIIKGLKRCTKNKTFYRVPEPLVF